MNKTELCPSCNEPLYTIKSYEVWRTVPAETTTCRRCGHVLESTIVDYYPASDGYVVEVKQPDSMFNMITGENVTGVKPEFILIGWEWNRERRRIEYYCNFTDFLIAVPFVNRAIHFWHLYRLNDNMTVNYETLVANQRGSYIHSNEVNETIDLHCDFSPLELTDYVREFLQFRGVYNIDTLLNLLDHNGLFATLNRAGSFLQITEKEQLIEQVYKFTREWTDE